VLKAVGQKGGVVGVVGYPAFVSTKKRPSLQASVAVIATTEKVGVTTGMDLDGRINGDKDEMRG